MLELSDPRVSTSWRVCFEDLQVEGKEGRVVLHPLVFSSLVDVTQPFL